MTQRRSCSWAITIRSISYGVDRFLADAKAAGVDGLIIVDLPPEEDDELCLPAMKAGINFIRLATPTTDDKRAPTVLKNTSGFVYYVSVLGITGTKTPDLASVKANVTRLKTHTSLPIAVGFGVKTAEQARDHCQGCRWRGCRHGAGQCGARHARCRWQADGEDRCRPCMGWCATLRAASGVTPA